MLQLFITKQIFLNIYHFPSTITNTSSFYQPNTNLLCKSMSIIKNEQEDAKSLTQFKKQKRYSLILSKRNLKMI